MSFERLVHIEQSIAETEMRMTIQRALMERMPEIHRLPSVAMAILRGSLRQKRAIRQEILEEMMPREA